MDGTRKEGEDGGKDGKKKKKKEIKLTDSLTQLEHLPVGDAAPGDAADGRPLALVLDGADGHAGDVVDGGPHDDVVERALDHDGLLLLEVELEGECLDVLRRLVRVAEVVHEGPDLEAGVLDDLKARNEEREGGVEVSVVGLGSLGGQRIITFFSLLSSSR